jgi:hypothetical protein
MKNKQLIYLLTALLCFGCSDIRDGVVTEKYHIPASIQIMTTIVGNAVIPIPRTSPELWVIYINQGYYDGNCYVSEIEYLEINVGDYFNCK